MKINFKFFSFLFSFLSASLLWFYTVNLNKSELSKEIELNILPPNKMGVVSELPKNITYTLKGSKVFLRKISMKKIEINLKIDKLIPLNKRQKNTMKITFNENDINLPYGIEVTNIYPQNILVKFEKLSKKKLPLTLNYINLPEKDLKLKFSYEPKKIEVKAGKSLFKKISSIPLETVNFSTLDKSQGELELMIASNADKRLIMPQELKVKLKYQYYKSEKILNVLKKKIRFITSNKVYKVNLRFAQIKVKVIDNTLNEEKIRDLIKSIEIIADIPDTRVGKHKVNLTSKSPIQLQVQEIQPQSIYVYTR